METQTEDRLTAHAKKAKSEPAVDTETAGNKPPTPPAEEAEEKFTPGCFVVMGKILYSPDGQEIETFPTRGAAQAECIARAGKPRKAKED